ncbi:hypothetical protein K443DRAFT_681603 [Laccaria amethystina LaAM-08-1]|uniref:Uncharacterized protein n=1 Tax=Laccaria amethystina LaAM-08-1 TaxID=1095629 RepID=A0A0C9XI79_9AGAR|nr:hypothetical protein K443DRAFT_681603 [Laccaria amethystina LaAM-08-1]
MCTESRSTNSIVNGLKSEEQLVMTLMRFKGSLPGRIDSQRRSFLDRQIAKNDRSESNRTYQKRCVCSFKEPPVNR